jgi:adenosylhomocysteine nucleosidase
MADHVTAIFSRGAEDKSTGTPITAILFPLRLEARPFLERLGTTQSAAYGRVLAWRATFHGNDLLIVRTGVGRRPTVAVLDTLLTRGSIRTVISAGFAGALAPELGVAEVIAARDVIDEKMASAQATWLPPGIGQGRILTMARVIGDPAEKRHLYAQYQACAVDMESAIIGNWCAKREIQFGVVRAITDDAGTAIAPAVARLVSNDRWSVFAGVLGMACEPRESIRQLWRLRRNAQLAGERLAEVLCGALQGSRPELS